MSLARSLFRFDSNGWRPIGAALRFLGVALAVSVGGAVGGRGAAVLAGVGALYAGIASFGGVHQARLKRMVVAVALASAATLLGCLVEPHSGLTILVVTFATFGLAILGAAGADAAQAALLATGTLVVFSGLNGASLHPLGNAALVLGGGLGPTLLVMVFHPISPFAAERRAVETIYAGLKRFAGRRASGIRDESLPDVAANAAARDLLTQGIGYGSHPELEKLWNELELADALRGSLAGLDRTEASETVWRSLAEWLGSAQGAIARGRPIERSLPRFVPTPEAAPWLQRIRRTIEAEAIGRIPTGVPSAQGWLAALRNVEAVRSIAFGYALRYALALGVATAGYRIFHVDHGYWAPLALAFSLKADYASTLTRGVGRIVGTAAGVTLATVFVAATHPSPTLLGTAMLASVWVAFSLLNASFVAYSTMLAFYVVVSVTLSGASVSTIGLERLGATLVGSGLALVIALLWPQWEAGRVRTLLAVAFALQSEYADAVVDAKDREALAAHRLRARAARLEAERTVAAAALEPRWSRRDHLQGVEAALARLSENAARILSAHIAALDPHPDDPDANDLRRLVAEDRGVAADLMG